MMSELIGDSHRRIKDIPSIAVKTDSRAGGFFKVAKGLRSTKKKKKKKKEERGGQKVRGTEEDTEKGEERGERERERERSRASERLSLDTRRSAATGSQ